MFFLRTKYIRAYKASEAQIILRIFYGFVMLSKIFFAFLCIILAT